MSNQSEKSQSDLEWKARTLCSDEGCIGVIGPDGRCLECGRPYDGDLPDGFAETAPAEAVSELEEEGDQDIPAVTDDDSGSSEPRPTDNDWETRQLCPDESCIGVIGPEGRCLECGRTVKDG